uniref:Uncharacterized protein n=1 Tax=Anabas testudineus TaxID=64144 RepID=A0A3Q1KES8_ANATE
IKTLKYVSGLIFCDNTFVLKLLLTTSNCSRQLTSGYLPGADLMIAIGVIIMVLGFFGCCGAIRENRCLLLLVDDWVKEQMNKLSPLSSQPTDVQAEVEQLQQQLKCCGLLNGPSDWNPVPSSCRCNGTASNCGTNGYYSTPCANQVISVLKSNMLVVLGIAFAIAVLLIFGMVFSMILYCQIGRKEGAISPGRA